MKRAIEEGFPIVEINRLAVLEFTLKEKLGKEALLNDLKEALLNDLIGEAVPRLLDLQLGDQARRIQRRGNEVAHRYRSDENDSLVQIRETVEVLSHLCSR